jgi:hypothetical protein
MTAAILLLLSGCGITRSTDTTRSATEQLLISDAIDRAVQTVNFQSLRGHSVYLDDQRLAEIVDRNYLVSSLRQHLLASGCALRDKREEADFIVEARAGAVGTDRNDLLFGVPSMNVPQILPMQPTPAAIPEIPFAKRRDQRGIAKIAVFAYHRESGVPVWQSGLAHQESSANEVWILGAGPFQRGTIYDGMEFAGKTLGNETPQNQHVPIPRSLVSLSRERAFASADQLKQPPTKSASNDGGVVPAAHEQAAASAISEPAPIAVAENAAPIASAPPASAANVAPAAAVEPAGAAPPPDPVRLPQPRFDSR